MPLVHTVSAMQLITSRNFNNSTSVCKLCQNASTDLYRHLILGCHYFNSRRTSYLNEIEAGITTQISTYLKQLSPEDFLRSLLDTSSICGFTTSPEKYKSYTNISAKYIHDVLMKYKYW